MTSSGTVSLEDVWRALSVCLPGWKKAQKTHNWWVYPADPKARPFMLPLGAHGKRDNVSIQRGHVKSMARQFGIYECMLEHVVGL